jgi:diaminohydroxyphosphoribosylaminopyrimidine deaminase/5-amino-6-(5-phosphoribosylamino)uracil reductase
LQDIQSVIIEGGAHTLNTFIHAGLWDEARIFTGTAELKKGIAAPDIKGFSEGALSIGTDNLSIFYNR